MISAEEAEAGAYQALETRDIASFSTKRSGTAKRTGLVDHRLIQGWSEIAAYHVDRVLGLYMKPPMISRMFDNHYWFSHEST